MAANRAAICLWLMTGTFLLVRENLRCDPAAQVALLVSSLFLTTPYFNQSKLKSLHQVFSYSWLRTKLPVFLH